MKDTALAKIRELKSEFDRLVEETGRPLFVELMQPIFEKFPEIEAVRWNQYVPGFNDGDPCVFSVSEPEVSFVDKAGDQVDDRTDEEREEDGDEEVGWHGAWSERVKNVKGLRNRIEDACEELQELEDVCEKVFDSNAQITIYRDGTVESDYYECGY